MAKKQRRNISLDPELDRWLTENVDNASELITQLLLAYRAYGGEEMEAVGYILEKRLRDTADDLE